MNWMIPVLCCCLKVSLKQKSNGPSWQNFLDSATEDLFILSLVPRAFDMDTWLVGFPFGKAAKSVQQ